MKTIRIIAQVAITVFPTDEFDSPEIASCIAASVLKPGLIVKIPVEVVLRVVLGSGSHAGLSENV